jgi:hypothetical protein
MVEPALLLRCCAVRLHHTIRMANSTRRRANSVFPCSWWYGMGFWCDLNIALDWKRSAEPQDLVALRIWQPIGSGRLAAAV